MTTQNVLITGVHGIGGAMAQIYLENNAKVWIVDRDPAALKKINHDNVVKVEADVGTEDGVSKIKAAVGDAPISVMVMAAATASDQGGRGHPSSEITRENFQDMISTSVFGKIFVIQALIPNLKASPTKARILNIGAPFADGPMPNGNYMCIPGWVGYGAAKAASKYMWEGFKVEMGDVAFFGYGHPGLTRTSLTEYVHDNYKEDMMISKMVQGRFGKKDYMMPEEPANLFYHVITKTSDDDFQGKTWGIKNMCATFKNDVKFTHTSDVADGIKLPDDDAETVASDK